MLSHSAQELKYVFNHSRTPIRSVAIFTVEVASEVGTEG